MTSAKSDGFKNLAVAIVEQAIEDYKKRPHMRNDCKRFFTSELCDLCCMGIVTGEQIINKLEGARNESFTLLERHRIINT